MSKFGNCYNNKRNNDNQIYKKIYKIQSQSSHSIQKNYSYYLVSLYGMIQSHRI
jgi:hypothetical protein